MKASDEDLSRWNLVLRWQDGWMRLLEKRADALLGTGEIPGDWAGGALEWLRLIHGTSPSPMPSALLDEWGRMVRESEQAKVRGGPLDSGYLFRMDCFSRRLLVWVKGPLRKAAWDCRGRAMEKDIRGGTG